MGPRSRKQGKPETPVPFPTLRDKVRPYRQKRKGQGISWKFKALLPLPSSLSLYPLCLAAPPPPSSHSPAGTCIRKLTFIDHLVYARHCAASLTQI